MTLRELDTYFRSLLDIEGFAGTDSSLNGVQVGNLDAAVNKVAFAVDACLEVFMRAAEKGADTVFVHHGLFWGRSAPVTGALYERIRTLVTKGLSLYAVHLPLDMHPLLGNNSAILRTLGICGMEPFGVYKGRKIGYKGQFDKPCTIDDILLKLGIPGDDIIRILPFGKNTISTVGVVSGGASMELSDAIAEELDLYVTGEASHEVYHLAMESGINMLSAGHYATETFGVREMESRLGQDTGLPTVYIDYPTGL